MPTKKELEHLLTKAHDQIAARNNLIREKDEVIAKLKDLNESIQVGFINLKRIYGSDTYIAVVEERNRLREQERSSEEPLQKRIASLESTIVKLSGRI